MKQRKPVFNTDKFQNLILNQLSTDAMIKLIRSRVIDKVENAVFDFESAQEILQYNKENYGKTIKKSYLNRCKNELIKLKLQIKNTKNMLVKVEQLETINEEMRIK